MSFVCWLSVADKRIVTCKIVEQDVKGPVNGFPNLFFTVSSNIYLVLSLKS